MSDRRYRSFEVPTYFVLERIPLERDGVRYETYIFPDMDELVQWLANRTIGSHQVAIYKREDFNRIGYYFLDWLPTVAGEST